VTISFALAAEPSSGGDDNPPMETSPPPPPPEPPPAPPPPPPAEPPPEPPPSPPDADGDGIFDSVDNCVDDANENQADKDGDKIGDVCDPQDDTDTDKDGNRDAIDNCPDEANPGQADKDRDGIGDVCDSNVDGDGADKRTPAPASPEAKQAQSPPRLDTVPPPNPTGFKSAVGEKFVTISWGSVAEAKEYVVTRSGGTQLAAARDTVVYEGPATTFTDRTVKKGAEYRYVVAAVDAAGNRSAGVVITVTPRAVYLVKPPTGLRVTRGRVDFRWAPVRGAGYYNLQLYRQAGRGAQAAAQGTKVLSTWPSRARYSLASSWKYKGKRYALRPGSYVWYIWPGFGARAKEKYGDLLGQSAFIVTKPRN
jgi:hypothetical protein